MGLIFKISLRNLFRQKRRSFFLGLAIAIGMMILVVTSSFTRGITDIILNKMLVYSFGHVSINFIENGRRQATVIRDKDRIIKIIQNVKGIKEINQYMASYTRVVGNGKAEMMALVGMPAKNGLEYFANEVKTGNIFDFTNTNIENPVVMAENKAKDLNVKIGDSLNVRLQTITGQVQTAKLTLVCITKAANLMQSTAFYIPHENMKKILGYRSYETGPLQVVLNKMDNPKAALVVADQIHKLLKPELAAYYGSFYLTGNKIEATALSFFSNTNDLALLTNQLILTAGKWVNATNSNTILISTAVAKRTGAGIGSKITGVYQNKFEKGSTTNSYTVSAIFNPGKVLGSDVVLISENNFYPGYYKTLPAGITNYKAAYMPASNSALYPALATEWKLLKRTLTSEEFQKKMRTVYKEKWEGAYLDVSTMYEVASFILQMESVLNSVSLIAVLILFFVILIGVINTLRMTIRERTREIGTIRAIGMQKKDVLSSFILETFNLTLLGCLAGIALGLIVIGIITLIKIDTDSVFSILLYEKHLNFVPSPGNWGINLILLILFGLEVLLINLDEILSKWIINPFLILFVLIGFFTSASGNGILTYLILILQMLVAIAYFPAKKAAAMSAASALRHYE